MLPSELKLLNVLKLKLNDEIYSAKVFFGQMQTFLPVILLFFPPALLDAVRNIISILLIDPDIEKQYLRMLLNEDCLCVALLLQLLRVARG